MPCFKNKINQNCFFFSKNDIFYMCLIEINNVLNIKPLTVLERAFKTHSDSGSLRYLDESFLVSTRKVLGLSLCFFPLSHHLYVKSHIGNRSSLSLLRKKTSGFVMSERRKHTCDILSRCLLSRLSFAFSKSACSLSSPGASRYLSTASGGLGAIVGTTGKQREGR